MSNHQVSRRNFLKLSAVAGVAISSGDAYAGFRKAQIPVRTLGNTGIRIPVLSMGVFSSTPAVVKAAYLSGVIHFDTANDYQNGRSEEMLGSFFVDKPRDSFIMATKIDVRKEDTVSKLIAKFDAGMKRLKMDFVDILYIHDVRDADTVHGIGLQAMQQLQKEGRAKYIGVSTHTNEPEVIHAVVDNGNYNVILTAYNFGQKHLDELNPAMERAAKSGLGIIGMKVIAGNFRDRERTEHVNAKAAIKWALQNPNIHTIVPGYSSFEELEECLDAVAHPDLTPDEQKFLSSVSYTGLLYCQGCRKCLPQCPAHLPVPDLMRAYMYQYGYGKPSLAKDVVAKLAIQENPCGECVTCTVSCTAGFQIARKVRDIIRLRHIPDEFLG